MEVEFDLQLFLTEMEQRLSDKIDSIDVVAVVSEHETRLVVVEYAHTIVRWFMGVTIVGAITFAGNWLVHSMN